jgi:thiosulfate/3-mercaptopyruvate sulfurtransferase
MLDASEFLIEPDELVKFLGGNHIIIDARKPEYFKGGHIPGAVPFSTYGLLAEDTSVDGIRRFAETMANRFMMAGVTPDRPVVVYDDDTGMYAARELWMLEFLGHRNVRMLHGGLNFWRRVGGPIDTDIDVPTVRTKPFKPSLTTGFLAGSEEVARRIGTWNFWLIDVRDDLAWSGREKAACCRRHGHIPHAKHIEWTKFLSNGRFKSPSEILELIEGHGINPRHDIVVYCHRGARSANTVYALRSAGIHSARNFVGSWHEWSAHADLPIEV